MSTGDVFNTSEDIKKLKVKIAGLYSSFGLSQKPMNKDIEYHESNYECRELES
jgi:hypothetical protein